MGFLNDLFGKSAQQDIQRANKQATGQLEQGYRQQGQRYDQAAGLYDPYVQEGRAASDFYTNALGLNGAEAAQGAYDTMAANPMFQGQLANDSNALHRSLNARGQGAGGLAAMAGQRVFQQTAGDWLDRYRDAGRDGYSATNALAGVRAQQGDNAMGYGATRAGQSINHGNALAESRNIGVNNLIGLIGAGGSVLNAFNKPKLPGK